MDATSTLEIRVSCTACGEAFADVAASISHECATDDTALFLELAELEYRVSCQRPAVSDAPTSQYALKLRAGDPKAAMRRAQAKLFAALNALTAEQQQAYGQWRKAHLAN